MTTRIAFSCTCHPHRKEVQPHTTRHLATRTRQFMFRCGNSEKVHDSHLMNCSVLLGQAQSLARAGSQSREVRARVVAGEMLGSTACSMSCTRPPVMLPAGALTPSSRASTWTRGIQGLLHCLHHLLELETKANRWFVITEKAPTNFTSTYRV